MTPQISLSIPQFKPKGAPSGLWGGLSWREGGELLESARCDLHNKWDTKAERRLLSHSHWPLGTLWSSIMMIIMMRICSSKQGGGGGERQVPGRWKGQLISKKHRLSLSHKGRERERAKREVYSHLWQNNMQILLHTFQLQRENQTAQGVPGRQSCRQSVS